MIRQAAGGGWRRPVLVLALTTAACAARAGFPNDPLRTAVSLPASAGQRVAAAGLAPCTTAPPAGDLTLLDTVRRALCSSPRTREAWSEVEAHAAAVGIGRSAYLPTVNLSTSLGKVNELDKVSDAPELDTSLHGDSNEETIGLNWVVYDFGLRAANLRQERALLDAAAASQDEAIQAVFIEGARDYFQAEQAQATVNADIEAEQAARSTMDAVQVKVGAGVAAEADWLQVRTAYAQADLKRIRDEESLKNALGLVALAIGLRPDVSLLLAKPGDSVTDVPQLNAMADQLIDRALHSHPRISAAQARLSAANDAADAARAAGRPSLAFAAVGDRSDNPINRVSTRQTIETSSIGLQLTIPLFEGFGRSYRIRRAQAEADGREAELLEVQREVSREVWESYVAMRGSSESLAASKTLLDTATQSFNLALGRYKSGIGGLVELLKAQSDLAAAQEEDVWARTRWRLSRLQLAASLGSIDFRSLKQ